MNARYTEIMMTVIAVALVALVAERALPTAVAQGSNCLDRNHPCLVALVQWDDSSSKYRECEMNRPCVVVLTANK
jgi:hypothetical protein